MPLTAKGQEIMAGMKKQYGDKKGEEVFYASKNKGTISGVDSEEGESLLDRLDSMAQQVNGLGARAAAAVKRVDADRIGSNKFSYGDRVSVKATGETGKIVGAGSKEYDVQFNDRSVRAYKESALAAV